MTLCVKYILFAFVIITMLKEGKSQWGLDLTFLQQIVVDFFFPKDPGIVRVRSMDQARGMGGTVVLDFVSTKKLSLKQTEFIVKDTLSSE